MSCERQVEMILVDDGSQDATLEIAEAYRERFRARGFDYRVVTGPHQNASAAINLGLPWVRGEFLIWPDSDDALEPDSVRVRAEFLQSHPQYQCVRSLMRCWDEAGRSLPVWENLGDLKEERLFFPVLEGQTFVCCGCYMLRTRALFDLYPRRRIPEYEVGQNFQMLLPVLYRWPCPTIPEALYHVCVRADSHSRRLRNREEEIARCAGFEPDPAVEGGPAVQAGQKIQAEPPGPWGAAGHRPLWRDPVRVVPGAAGEAVPSVEKLPHPTGAGAFV